MRIELPTLLAETRLTDVSQRYREEVTTTGVPDVVYFLLIGVAIAIGYLSYRYVTRRTTIFNTPLGLLNDLCQAHHVTESGELLLQQISAEAKLEHPAMLFLSASNFEAAVERAGATIKYDRGQQTTLNVLRRTLFDD